MNQVKIDFVIAFICQLLTSHYEQRWRYYSQVGGHGDQGLASEEELLLSRKLFWGVFRALAKKVSPCQSQYDIQMI